jgi:hypothetical protein
MAKNKFRLWDAVHDQSVRERSDAIILRLENRYSIVIFDYKHHTLLSACGDITKWCEHASAVSESQHLKAHSRPIVRCFLPTEFDQIVMIDSICTIKVWDFCDVLTIEIHQESPCPEASDVTEALDATGRRMIKTNFKNRITLCGSSGRSMTTGLKLGIMNALITYLQFA